MKTLVSSLCWPALTETQIRWLPQFRDLKFSAPSPPKMPVSALHGLIRRGLIKEDHGKTGTQERIWCWLTPLGREQVKLIQKAQPPPERIRL